MRARYGRFVLGRAARRQEQIVGRRKGSSQNWRTGRRFNWEVKVVRETWNAISILYSALYSIL